MEALRRDFLPDDLVPHMEQAGVVNRAVIDFLCEEPFSRDAEPTQRSVTASHSVPKTARSG